MITSVTRPLSAKLRQTPPNSSASRRPPSIDALTSLRGLAALWVVLFHFDADIARLVPLASVGLPFLSVGHLAVPFFFVLSGFVLCYNYYSSFEKLERATWLRFIGRRLLRIYPTHLATLLCVLAMALVARSRGLEISDNGYLASDFLLNLFLVHTWTPYFYLNWNFPAWSISSEWFAYLWFPLIATILHRAPNRAWLVAGLFASFAFMHFHEQVGMWYPFNRLIGVVGPFLVGCFLARLTESAPAWCKARGLATLLAVAVVATPFVVPRGGVTPTLLTLFPAVIYTAAVRGEHGPRWLSHKILINLGEVSYSLYLTHAIVMKLLYELAPTQGFAESSWHVRLAVFVLYASAIVAATAVCYYAVERPGRHLLARKPPAPAAALAKAA